MEFIKLNMIWVAAACVSGGMLLWQLLRNIGGVASISPVQATLMINREAAVVLDVRSSVDFLQGHIPNARNIPLEHLADRLSELRRFKASPVIVPGDARSACDILCKNGFAKVFSLAGGLVAWSQAGLPVSKKK